MRGDRVEVLVDVGNGVRAFEIVASKDGRRVEVATVRGNVHVTEVTRTGREIRTARFIASRVIAVVEHPAEEEGKQTRKRKPKAQQSML